MTEEELFNRATEMPREEREAFLREACGDDDALRASVESLLAGYESTAFVLDTPLGESDAFSPLLEDDTQKSSEAEDPFVSIDNEPIPFGDYRLEKEIARGAMGVVYRAEQTSLKRTVAIKMIRSAMLAGEEDLARFKGEAEAAAGLDHPNIVPIYEIGEHEGQHFFSMKLIEGGTLNEAMESLREDRKAAAKLMATVARAIHVAHQHGILHRDLKPGNILLDEAGEPHVTDFGLAKQMESSSSMTLTGQIMGTPFYMAPEQAEGGAKELTTEADIYSLGALLYQVLTGKLPLQGDSLVDTLKRVVEEEPVAPRKVDPSIPRDLETIVLKCLDKDPDKRYPSAVGLADDLDRWQRGEPVLARPVGGYERLVKWMRRRPALAAAWGLLVAFLLTLGIGGPIVAFRQTELMKEVSAEKAHAVEAEKNEAAARVLAQESAEENRRNLYLAEMNLASQAAMESGGIRRFRGLLDKWIPAEGEQDLRGWEWYHLDTRHQKPVRSFRGHGSQVLALDWSPATGRIISGSFTGEIRGWGGDSEEAILQGGGKRGSADVLAWNPDGTRFVSGGGDGTLRLRDGESGEVLAAWPEREAKLRAVRWSPDGKRLATGWGDGLILIGDPEGGAEPVSIEADPKRLRALAWSPDGAWLASGGNRSRVEFWDSRTGKKSRQIAETGLVHALAWSPNGRFLAAVIGANAIVVRNADSGDLLLTLEGHDGLVAELAWSPDSGRLASASWDHTARIWDIATGRLESTFRQVHKVTSISWSPDGRQVAVAVANEVLLYHADDEEILTLRGHGSEVTSVHWDATGDRLVTAGMDGSARIWLGGKGRQELEFREHPEVVRDAAWSPTAERVASVGRNGELRIWHPGTGEVIHSLEAHLGGGLAVRWSPDGNRLASVGGDRFFRVWDNESGRELAAIEVESRSASPLNSLAWSPDGTCLAVPDQNGGIVVWNAESFTRDRRLECLRLPCTSVAWSPCGDRLALGFPSGVIQVLDAGGSGETLELAGHNSMVTSVAWSPDGARLVSGGIDYSIRVWDAVTGAQCLVLRGHEERVTSVAWSPDGTRLASASRDQTVKIWDSRRRERLDEEPR